ncbi:hypothetical protein FNF27_05975 [Cafeteria roenbergensis]|uniref:Uncharacterized protein n=2 Tax=Cafeteria roenbergensis TaxID=33653 RepID=A0A5A8E950_CAFRO|nr:hypothetical protein FNF31_07328 [Cafeteria roenbergensis]KAA0158915.1 hypothetical protein FNF28_06055 [Cafeteria roenbergensis]KAA0172500.1 hypothetical protein FNF27_05975 [Cafeteria roenbergensis]
MFRTLLNDPACHTDTVTALAWGRDGSLVTASIDETLTIHDVAAPESDGAAADSGASSAIALTPRHVVKDLDLGIVSLSAARHANIVAGATMDSVVKVWALDSGEELLSVDPGALQAWCVDWHPSKPILAATTHSGAVSLLDGETGEKRRAIDTRAGFASCVAFSPDGGAVATASLEGKVSVMDVETGALLHSAEPHRRPIRSLVWAPDGTRLLTGSDDARVTVLDVGSTGLSAVHSLAGHTAPVTAVAMRPDGLQAVSASADTTARLWDLRAREPVHTFRSHEERIGAADYSADGVRVATGDDAGRVCVHAAN